MGNTGKKWAGIIIFCMVVSGAQAATITASPDGIEDGGTVHIGVSDLKDGTQFSLIIDADFAVSPGSAFSYSTDHLVLPFTLKDAETTVHTQNAQTIEVNVKKGGTTKGMKGIADAGGSITTTLLDTITAGTYDGISLAGTVQEDKHTISTGVGLTGEKDGPEDAEISFTVNGIDDGTVTVIAFVDGEEELRKVVAIGEGASTADTPAPSDRGGEGSQGTGAPLTPSPAITSVDGTVRLTGTGTEAVSILKVKAEKVPADWQALTGAYTLSPAGAAFSPTATLNFRIPATADPKTWTLFLASYEGGKWQQVPSRIEGEWIGAEIPVAGTYALMTFALTTPTATPLMTGAVGETPGLANVTTPPPTSAPPTTPEAAMGTLPALGALIGLLYLTGRHKRH